MAPTIIIFKGGIKETVFKAGLDLELPADLKKFKQLTKSMASKFSNMIKYKRVFL